jgi:hypothetical protein
MGQGLRKFVLAAPIRPARASVAYEVTLKFLVAAYAFVLTRPAHKAFSARTRWHRARAFPLDKDFVSIRVRHHACPIRIGPALIDVIKESAINSGLVYESFALVVEHDPRNNTSINSPVWSQLLHLTGEGPAMYLIAPIAIVLPHIRDGELLPLGVTTARRSTLLPDVPTIAEAGVAGFDFPIWYGIWVPAGTPAGVVNKLSRDIGRVLAGPDLREWITKHGGEPMSMTQPEFARFVQSESESAARLINADQARPRTNP